MIKTILIDDEPLARDIVKYYLMQITRRSRLWQNVMTALRGYKSYWTQHNPDLIFLDIQMPKITGFEMLELVEDQPVSDLYDSL
jgi:two-component system LytT family response regulator